MNKIHPWHSICHFCLLGGALYRPGASKYTKQAKGCDKCAQTGMEPIPDTEVFKELRVNSKRGVHAI